MKIIIPTHGEAAYAHAATAFVKLYQKITDIELPIVTEDDGGDIVLIGSDTVNDVLMEMILAGSVGELGIRYGSDDYCMRALEQNGRRILILAGGRGRSTLYAVYDWFERVAGCHYFWDGDVIPHLDALPITDIDVQESPRFEYRGFRYFAHRSLHRFQAEHWGYEDWKKELLWLTKRRLNFFMLRIGMDDLWQRAFPECCDYSVDEPGEGYNDRTPFWDLKYRGELRERVLAFARELDLIHPEDCGTMSHWYSPAPDSFIEKEAPDFFPQADTRYSSRRTLVWDIRKQRNMDKYMKLTETAVREYNPDPEFFHTIGLGERNMMPTKEENFRLKKITLRRIAQSLRERYPHAKLLVAGWDFIGWWKGEEVAEYLREMDPSKTVILDYTAEADDPEQCFLNWGMVGKFPYIFGLFHGYQANSALRGPYERSDARLRVAAGDPYCKGMVVWPELSHSDPLMLEYLAQNAWEPLVMNIEEITARYCARRYGERAEGMNALWQAALPIIKIGDWGGFTQRDREDPEARKYVSTHHVHREMWTDMLGSFINAYQKPYATANFTHAAKNSVSLWDHFAYKLDTHSDTLRASAAILRQSRALYCEDPFISRDIMDIVRTTLGRYMNFMLMRLILGADSDDTRLRPYADKFLALMDIMGDLLYLHEDYSLAATLQRLKKEHPVTDGFETTLKRNASCNYCRAYIAENCRHLYLYECRVALDWLLTPKNARPETDFKALKKQMTETFINTPLSEQGPIIDIDFETLMTRAADIIEEAEQIEI